MARTKSKRKPHVHGCCERGDHRISRPKPQPAVQPWPPTEPCPICLEVVGLTTQGGIIESWASLPCGHRFGGYCLKVWLGMNKNAICPFCKETMLHACGHPPLPRPAPPPAFDAADIQPGDDRVPGKPDSVAPDAQQEAQDVQDAQEIPEVPEAQEAEEAQEAQDENKEDEAVECDKADNGNDSHDCQQGSSRVDPKNNIRVAAQRVRSFGGVAQPSRPGEPSSNNNGGVAAAGEPPAAPEAANVEQPVAVAPLAQPEPPAASAAPQAAPNAAAPAAAPVEALPMPPGIGSLHGPNSRRRRRLRRKLHHGLSQEAYEDLPPPAPAAPIGSEQTDDFELLASMLAKRPAQMPKYMAMAYPRTVDLTLPCTYCYLTLERKPQESPKRNRGDYYRSSKSRIPGKKLAMRGARQVALGSVTIVRTAGIAIRFLIHGSRNSNTELTQREEQLLAAYWVAWRQVRNLAFSQWWAEQAPRSDPAVATPPDNWNLYNLAF